MGFSESKIIHWDVVRTCEVMNHAITHSNTGVSDHRNKPGYEGQRCPHNGEREASTSWIDLRGCRRSGARVGWVVFFVEGVLCLHLWFLKLASHEFVYSNSFIIFLNHLNQLFQTHSTLQHGGGFFSFFDRNDLTTSSNTLFSPFWVSAEHSKYPYTFNLFASSSPSFAVTQLLLSSSLRSVFVPTIRIGAFLEWFLISGIH